MPVRGSTPLLLKQGGEIKNIIMKTTNRRNFIKTTGAIGAFTVVAPAVAFGYKSNSAVRMGIIGCGGRGTGVISTMSRNANIEIVAMADLFQDKLDGSHKILNKANQDKGFSKIPDSSTYVGAKAYAQLLDNPDIDAVLVSSPAYTHADFLEATVKAGKHVYCEKPAAPDVAGCRKVERIGREYDGKLSMTIGFQIRRATTYGEMVKRIRDGAIGDVISGELHYFSSMPQVKDISGMSYDESRIRNQYHFRELSGGILLDQGIHIIDVCNWTLGSHPISAVGTGSRKGRTYGNSWSNYQAVLKYPDDINISFSSSQIGPAFGDVCARFMGTEGIAQAHYSGGVFISGKNNWDSGIAKSAASLSAEQRSAGVFLSALHDADPNKGASFIRSIETGDYLNELQAGVDSTLSASLAREAATRAEECTWEENYHSNSRLNPGLDLSVF